MPSRRLLPLLAVAALGACGNKVTSNIDNALQAKVDTLQDCFPGLYAWVQGLLDIADTWKLTSADVPDPAGLTWSAGAGGRVDVALNRGGTTIAMQVRFYDSTGAEQDLSAALAGATTLGDAVHAAAAELRNRFGAAEKFMLGEWSISGGGITASGEALVGIIGGATQDRLTELRTTQVTVTAPNGVPPVDASTITDNGPPVCSLTFRIASLVSDEDADQTYPIGDIALTIAGPAATIDATITFDGTSTARVAIEDVPGRFAFDIAARSLTYQP